MYNTCTATFNLFGLDSGLHAGNMHWRVEMQQITMHSTESLNLKSASKYHQLLFHSTATEVYFQEHLLKLANVMSKHWHLAKPQQYK